MSQGDFGCPQGLYNALSRILETRFFSENQFNLDLNLDSTCAELGLEAPMLRRYFLTNITLLVGSIQHW